MIIGRVYDKDSEDKTIQQKEPKPMSVIDRIRERENQNKELKSSFRYDYNENIKGLNPKLEKVIAKTVSAFMNAAGGSVFVGVSDSGEILGLQPDYMTLRKQDSDGFELAVRQSIEKYTKNKMPSEYTKFEFHLIEGKEICEIIVSPTPKPVSKVESNRNVM